MNEKIKLTKNVGIKDERQIFKSVAACEGSFVTNPIAIYFEIKFKNICARKIFIVPKYKKKEQEKSRVSL